MKISYEMFSGGSALINSLETTKFPESLGFRPVLHITRLSFHSWIWNLDDPYSSFDAHLMVCLAHLGDLIDVEIHKFRICASDELCRNTNIRKCKCVRSEIANLKTNRAQTQANRFVWAWIEGIPHIHTWRTYYSPSLRSEVWDLKSEVWSLRSEVWGLRSGWWSPRG